MSQRESDQRPHNGCHDRLDQRFPLAPRHSFQCLDVRLDLLHVALDCLLLRGEDFDRRRQRVQRPVVLL